MSGTTNTGTPSSGARKQSHFSPGRILAIAQNTFREAVRHRVFAALALVGAALLLFSAILGELATTGQLRRVLINFGLFSVSLFCVLASVSLGAVLLHKEMDRKTVYTLLSKPVPRHEFLVGKYFGILAVVWTGLLGLGLVWFLVLGMQGVDVTGELVRALILIAFEAALVAAVAVMFSAVSSAVVTGILALGVAGVGRLIELVQEMLSSTNDQAFFVKNPDTRWLGELMVTIWPDLSVFNVSTQVLLEVPITTAYIGHAGLYCLGVVTVAVVLGMLGISRRDFV